MKQQNKCVLGIHNYKPYKEDNMVNNDGSVLGTIYIRRCECCGKVKSQFVPTNINYRNSLFYSNREPINK